MSTNAEVRAEVSQLQEKYRTILMEAAEKSAEGVLKLMPTDAETFSATKYARMRWEMLKGGFSHREIQGVLSKVAAISENKSEYPHTVEEWKALVASKYLSEITVETKRITLHILQQQYYNRLNCPTLNAHERAVFSIGKRINAVLERDPAETEGLIATIASECKVQPEMVYRVSTGGTKVTANILHLMDRSVRRIELVYQEQDEAANGG